MTADAASDHRAQLRQSIEQLEREERRLDADSQAMLASFDTQLAGLSQAQIDAAKKDMIASMVSTRAHLQAVRGDIARRLAIIEARARASGDGPTDPRSERRTELEDALEDLKLSEQRIEENVERQRAQILSMSPELMNPGADPKAVISEMLAQLDSITPEVRTQFEAARAEIERELAELN